MKPIKKRLVPLVLCLPIAAALLSSPPANAAQGAIVRVTLTSVWATPSPDPMGITYDARTKRLLISDSEVDEMPGLWKGRNLFVVRRRGDLVSSRTLKKFTVEPEDLAMDSRHRALYVTDDDIDRCSRTRQARTASSAPATMSSLRSFTLAGSAPSIRRVSPGAAVASPC